MPSATQQLEFEQPLAELEERIAALEQKSEKTSEQAEELRGLKRQLVEATRALYSQLDPWDTVRVARLPDRPKFTDYVELLFDEFVELHGDKFFGDDRALRTGFAKLDQYKVLVVGHHKGKTFKERTECFFGCAHPEGYRKSMAKMKLAAKYGLPIICLIDTPGAYPGIGAEERGQAQVIAQSMLEMSRLETPIVCVVIGVGDRVAVLEHAYYSVISPEGCAGILWKSHDFADKAARALKLTSKHLKELGAVDDVIEEPIGGAHRDHYQMASRLKMYLVKCLRELTAKPKDQLLAERYEKFRKIGPFIEA
jgi:acetyl-CoA carboxylase carboxyl transferase subunit alpha